MYKSEDRSLNQAMRYLDTDQTPSQIPAVRKCVLCGGRAIEEKLCHWDGAARTWSDIVRMRCQSRTRVAPEVTAERRKRTGRAKWGDAHCSHIEILSQVARPDIPPPTLTTAASTVPRPPRAPEPVKREEQTMPNPTPHPSNVKEDAIRRVLDENESANSVAEALGLPHGTVSSWACKARKSRPAAAVPEQPVPTDDSPDSPTDGVLEATVTDETFGLDDAIMPTLKALEECSPEVKSQRVRDLFTRREIARLITSPDVETFLGLARDVQETIRYVVMAPLDQL